MTLEEGYLAGFGSLLVPRHLWRALGRFSAWIEPAIVAEWCRLMQGYAMGQGRVLDAGAMAAAMAWSDPARDVLAARRLALGLIEAGDPVHCVWSGRRLNAAILDIDLTAFRGRPGRATTCGTCCRPAVP